VDHISSGETLDEVPDVFGGARREADGISAGHLIRHRVPTVATVKVSVKSVDGACREHVREDVLHVRGGETEIREACVVV
jgi:hypothetical protein